MKKVKHKQGYAHSALNIVRNFAPNVTRVFDADEPLTIEVTQKDCNSRGVKNHTECAMAVALKRSEHASEVIIARTTAYVIKNKTAYRYKVGAAIARELTSFDRGAAFEPGVYRLGLPGTKLGESKASKPHDSERSDGNAEKKRFRHFTENIRTDLREELAGGHRMAAKPAR